MGSPPDFDGHGQWTGVCEDCGTSHDGHGPGTLGAFRACLRARAAGATHVEARLDQLDAALAERAAFRSAVAAHGLVTHPGAATYRSAVAAALAEEEAWDKLQAVAGEVTDAMRAEVERRWRAAVVAYERSPDPSHSAPWCAVAVESVLAEVVDGTWTEDGVWWWLSFVDVRSDPHRFLGVAIVRASDRLDAVTAAHRLGCNPGGQVAFLQLAANKVPPIGWCGRLLSGREAADVVEAMTGERPTWA